MNKLEDTTNQNLSMNPSKFTHEKLHDALLHVQDMLERSLIPFVLLDETAKQMLTEMPHLDLPEITIGVMKKHWTQSGSSIFKSLVPTAEITEDTVNYTYNGVPIVIWIIHRSYSVFKYPDMRWYYQTEFHLPNPFSKYWKIRHLIK